MVGLGHCIDRCVLHESKVVLGVGRGELAAGC